MYKLLEKIREQSEGRKKAIAVSIVAVLMAVIGWTWIFTMKDNFDFNAEKTGTKAEESSIISPLESLKENFAALKSLTKEGMPPEATDIKPEAKETSEADAKNKNFDFFNAIKQVLNKSWRWAYDPIKK